MFLSLFKLIAGAFIITLPFWLTTNQVRRLLEIAFPKGSKGRKVTKILVIILHWFILEFLGLHLILDPIIPGQAIIYVDAPRATTDYPFVLENLRIQIAPVRFDGHPDFQRIRFGSFNHTGTYSTLVNFNWGESRVLIRVYDQAQPRKSLVKRYIHISPYVRVGLWDSHIDLEKLLALSTLNSTGITKFTVTPSTSNNEMRRNRTAVIGVGAELVRSIMVEVFADRQYLQDGGWEIRSKGI